MTQIHTQQRGIQNDTHKRNQDKTHKIQRRIHNRTKYGRSRILQQIILTQMER